jgi:hypothetical protein
MDQQAIVQAIVNAFHAAVPAPDMERDVVADAIPAQGDVVPDFSPSAPSC